ncbi:polyphosphate polymerase domain-containing protein [Brevibacillus brevis]|uniref:Polyphosphate polymerase domain-containing protein n=1 Tax=Brevibacillus brevis TaxID=1393 RepID=A0ABY9T1C6_BREBE|nr:polyphosphate polymerase domain-containing protein [Brevibacillus brevis]WNC13898.1 polyphosphate polymerase domain-containing protein [Brevibacillus brevis]
MHVNGKKLRHEQKYYINPQDYIATRNRLRTLMSLDRHSVSDEGYHIRSLYFDNLSETALYDKNNGVYQRKKYRIRIYNLSDGIIKLERKSKWNEYVLKEAASLTRQQTDRLLSGDAEWLRGEDHPLLADFYRDWKQNALKPSVSVDYIREAYIDEMSDTRITFDKRLAAGFHSALLFDRDLQTWEAIEGPRLILEVKFRQFLPHMIRSLLQMTAHQRSTISKYVLCKERQKIYTR